VVRWVSFLSPKEPSSPAHNQVFNYIVMLPLRLESHRPNSTFLSATHLSCLTIFIILQRYIPHNNIELRAQIMKSLPGEFSPWNIATFNLHNTNFTPLNLFVDYWLFDGRLWQQIHFVIHLHSGISSTEHNGSCWCHILSTRETLHPAHTVWLCVQSGPHNKQRLCP
jgi:hypothetical protein